MEIFRNLSAHPGFLPGVKMFAGRYTNTDTNPHNYIIETGCQYVGPMIARNGTTVVVGTEGASTAYPGTRTVTFACPGSGTNGGVLEFVVVGSIENVMAETAGAVDFTSPVVL